MSEQLALDLDRLPSGPIDQRTREILDLVHSDPAHEDDVRRVVAAITTDAVEHAGHVDPNRVRRHLVNERGDYLVTPQVVGSVYCALTRKGVLEKSVWTENTDGRGNSGKPIRTYYMPAAVAA